MEFEWDESKDRANSAKHGIANASSTMKPYKKELTNEELATLKDEEIDYSDIPATDEAFWESANVVLPRTKKAISLRLDADVLDYFQKEGPGYQTRINTVLKAYVDVMRSKANSPVERP